MKLGFDPNNLQFVLAIRSMAMSKTLWERKVEAYRGFGMSKDEIYSAFIRHPLFNGCFREEDQEIDGFLCEQTEDEAFADFQESQSSAA
jgi:hypothetical protein